VGDGLVGVGFVGVGAAGRAAVRIVVTSFDVPFFGAASSSEAGGSAAGAVGVESVAVVLDGAVSVGPTFAFVGCVASVGLLDVLSVEIVFVGEAVFFARMGIGSPGASDGLSAFGFSVGSVNCCFCARTPTESSDSTSFDAVGSSAADLTLGESVGAIFAGGGFVRGIAKSRGAGRIAVTSTDVTFFGAV
jgi:hypothetical protein